jgi:hypothetical protein
MKRLLLALSLVTLLSACVTLAEAPRYQDPCSGSPQYWGSTALGCRPYPMNN